MNKINLQAPSGDDSLYVEAGDMMQYFAQVKDYAYFVSGNKFEGHSSWKLHRTAEALTDLWMTSTCHV